MMPKEPQSKQILVEFGIVTFIAVASCGWFLFNLLSWLPERPRLATDPGEWPATIRNLSAMKHEVGDSVQVLIFDAFVDQKCVVMVHGFDDSIDELVSNKTQISNTLIAPFAGQHPKWDELVDSIPSDWPKSSLASCELFATVGYGFDHIEGGDLFLVAIDRKARRTYILYESIF